MMKSESKKIDNRKVICAGCQKLHPTVNTITYRKKRCCGSESCIKEIDKKVTHFNYMKQQKKIKKGTFRHGVPPDVRSFITERDKGICRLCKNKCEQYSSQIHHIKPVSAGGLDENKNLILLCSSCHTKVHQQGWEIFEKSFTNYTKTVMSFCAQ